MHLKLSDRLESYAQAQVASGLYSSTSEFIRELIRRHMEQEADSHRRVFHEAIRIGDTQLLRGEGTVYSGDYLRELGAKAKQNVENQTLTGNLDALPL